MRKWKIAGGIAGVLVAALLVGSIVMPAFAQVTPAQIQAAEHLEDLTDGGTDEQSPSYASSIRVNDAQHEGMSEADEAVALAGQAKVTPDQAKDAALKANPDTTVTDVELDNENGELVYSVELSNGMDVKVDAANGAVFYTEDSGTGNEVED